MHTSHTPDRYTVSLTGVHVCEHDRLRSRHRRCPNHAHSRSCSVPGRQDLFGPLWSRRTAVQQDALPWPYLHPVKAHPIVMSWVQKYTSTQAKHLWSASMSRHCNLSHSTLWKQLSEIIFTNSNKASMNSRARIFTFRSLLVKNKYHMYYKQCFECETTCILGNAYNVILAWVVSRRYRLDFNMFYVWLFLHQTIQKILTV